MAAVAALLDGLAAHRRHYQKASHDDCFILNTEVCHIEEVNTNPLLEVGIRSVPTPCIALWEILHKPSGFVLDRKYYMY